MPLDDLGKIPDFRNLEILITRCDALGIKLAVEILLGK